MQVLERSARTQDTTEQLLRMLGEEVRDGESMRSNLEGLILGNWEEVGKRVIGGEQIMMGQSSLSSWMQRESEESIELVMIWPWVTFRRAVSRRSLDLRSQISGDKNESYKQKNKTSNFKRCK